MLTGALSGLETCSPRDRKLPGANLVDGLLRHYSFSVRYRRSRVFNLKGEPIVNTPANAFNTFSKSEMDSLVLENFLVEKN
jgi:hypothetical protein